MGTPKDNRLRFGWFYGVPAVEWIQSGRSDLTIRLLRPFTFHRLHKQEDITVPAGFDCDGASIPRLLWTLVGSPMTGRYRDAAIIHDWLYHQSRRWPRAKRSRKDADRVFYEAMRANGVGYERAHIMYWAVRLFAGSRWGKR